MQSTISHFCHSCPSDLKIFLMQSNYKTVSFILGIYNEFLHENQSGDKTCKILIFGVRIIHNQSRVELLVQWQTIQEIWGNLCISLCIEILGFLCNTFVVACKNDINRKIKQHSEYPGCTVDLEQLWSKYNLLCASRIFQEWEFCLKRQRTKMKCIHNKLIIIF